MKKYLIRFGGVCLSLLLVLPGVVSAASVEELQAQINALLSQLRQMSTQSAYGIYLPPQGVCPAFTIPLALGSSQQAVFELQRFLNLSPDTRISAYGAGSPGYETQYYGDLTRAAVIRFQNKYAGEVLYPLGLSTGTGFMGASTGAKLRSLCAMEVALLKSNTTPVNPPVNNSTILNGGAGSISINSYSSDVERNVVTGEKRNILGFKVRADGSDLRVTHFKISMQYTGSNSNSLLRYFDSFEIVSDGVVLGTARASDFNRDSSGYYSMNIALQTPGIIRMGSNAQKIFYVRAMGVSSIDSVDTGASNSWTVRADTFRFNDATGATFSDSTMVSLSGVYVEKLGTSSGVKMRVSAGTNNPQEESVFISDTNSGDLIPLLEFRMKAEGTRILFDQLKVQLTTTGATPMEEASEFRLVRGTEVIDTVDSSEVTGLGVLTFNLDDLSVIGEEETLTYRIIARMNKMSSGSFTQGDTMSATFISINGQDKNGDSITSYAGSATGQTQTFRSGGLLLTKVSATQTNYQNNTNPSDSYGEYHMQIRAAASGDDLWIPLTVDSSGVLAGFIYSIEDSNNNPVTSGLVSHSVSLMNGGSRENGTYIKLADGESATFDIVVTFNPIASNQYRLQLSSSGYTTIGALGGATVQAAATPESDFQTSNMYIQN